ncbi:MAG: response regulator [Candidatus Protistobacter heckmanni]|nr:response regulator [Candidatus Protistobacter heckmanni]
MKILIVDGSKAMRMIVVRTLRAAVYEDCTFFEAEDGAESLKKARAEKPELVLTDWNMLSI